MQNPFEILDKRTSNIENILLDINLKLLHLEKNFQPKEPDENMTPNEVKDRLKCDRSTVHNLTVKGILKKYGCGGRVYYKRSEVEAALTPLNK